MSKVCLEQGCPSTCQPGKPRCPTHHAEHARSKSKARGYSAHAAGYDAAWERIARRYKRKHPDCERGCGRPSVDVHHVDHQGPRGPGGNAEANLEALCHECHSSETRSRQLTSADTLKTLQRIGSADWTWPLGEDPPDVPTWTPGVL